MKIRWVLPLIIIFWGCQSWDLSDPGLRRALVIPVTEDGFRIDVKEKDYPYILEMIRHEEPATRLAGLHLAGYNISDIYYPAVLEAALDKFPEISIIARDYLVAEGNDFLSWVTPRLAEMDYELLIVALDIIVDAGYKESSEQVMSLLYTDSPAMTLLAAETLAGMLDFNDPLILELQQVNDTRSRQAYYRILSFYRNREIIPHIIIGLDDDDPQVRGTVISALYGYNQALIPYLEELMSRGDYGYTVSVLQILEQMNHNSAIPLLLELSSSQYRNISQRAAILLQSMGKDFIPDMRETFQDAPDSQLLVFLWILDRVDHSDSLLAYRDIWLMNRPAVNSRAENGLQRFEQEGLFLLHDLFFQGESSLDLRLLTLLRRWGDPWLVMDEQGNIQIELAHFLLRNSSRESLREYGEVTNLPQSYKQELDLLRQAHELGSVYHAWDMVEEGQERGLYRQRQAQWEELIQAVREKEQAAREANQRYFENRERQWLELSRQYRQEASELQDEADALNELLEVLQNNLPDQYRQYLEHLQVREDLVDIWTSLSSTMRPLGERVYSYWGLSGPELQQLQRQY